VVVVIRSLKAQRTRVDVKDEVKSYKQTGGITAKNVQINNQEKFENKPNQRRALYGAITIAASIFAILNYFGIVPQMKNIKGDNQMEENINVTSHNQSGGINAYSVNIGSQPRRFSTSVEEQLKAHLPKDKSEPITLTAVMGDQEAFQFATEIKDYLETNDWKVNGVNQAIFAKPIKGQIVEKTSNGSIKITIGGMN